MIRPMGFLIGLAVLACITSAPSSATAESARPNILILVADDLGYSDLGCYGGEIQTPHLDGLAENGLRFTQFYNTARCWPSRAALLTGYYAQQVRRDAIPGLGGGAQGRRQNWARLLPDFLKPLGYRSYHSGKWHLDGQPLESGFDHSYLLNDQDRHFSPRQHAEDGLKLPPVQSGTGYYGTVAVVDHALKSLKNHAAHHAADPFFHYVAFTVPHFPIQALPEDITRYADTYDDGWDVLRKQRYRKLKKLGLVTSALSERDPVTVPGWNLSEAALQERVGDSEVGRAVGWRQLTREQKEFQSAKMAVHAAMIDRMDREIGRLLEQLKAMGAFDNTIILFLSDNGASAEQIIRGDGHDPKAPVGSAATFLGIGPGWSTAANTPFRLHKSWVHEGGIATPLIVHWPKGIAARGELRHNPGHLVDLVPTLLELAGGTKPESWMGTPIPPAPGRSLVPVFQKDRTVAHDYLWWYHSNNRALRVGDWKVVAKGEDGPWELYNLAKDRTETKDLAAKYPQRTQELQSEWRRHLEAFRELSARDWPTNNPPQRPRAPASKNNQTTR